MQLGSFHLVVAVLIAFGNFARAENWPEFRGPTGQGHAAARDLPIQWSNSQNVVWKQELPGEGWSSPVVHNGRIFLTAAVAAEGADAGRLSLRLFALNAESGKVMGSVEVFSQDSSTASKKHSKNSHASPTPLIDDERLFVHFGHHGVACLDLSGKIIWRNRELTYAPVHGNGGSPILTDEALVFSCDGAADPFVVALDRETGDLLWKTRRETDAAKTFSFSTPLLITVDGRQQVISPGSNCVCAYDPQSGREIWRVRYSGYSVIPRPVYGQGMIYISTGYDSPAIMAIRPDGQGDVTDTHVEWVVRKGAPNTPSLLLVGDELYMVSDRGVASCLDARTGEVHWQERIGGNYSASPVYADGKIYFQSEEGTGVVIQAGKQFRQLASNELGERTLASYAIADHAILIRTDKHLYRIEAPPGDIKVGSN
jgi:outer membrane protein assembly factor BamB